MKKTYTRNYLWRYLCSIFLAVTVMACGKSEPSGGDKPQPQPDNIPPKSHIYTEEGKNPISELRADGTVVYEANTPQSELPKVGEIICSGVTDVAKQGFIYRVEKVETKNGKTEVKTSPAYINEVIKNYKGRIPLNLKNSRILSVSDSEGRSIKYDQLRASTYTGGLSFEITRTIPNEDDKKNKKDKNKEDKNKEDNQGKKDQWWDYSADIKLAFSLDASLMLDVEWFQMNQFELELKATTQAEVGIKAKLKGKLKFDRELYTVDLAPITVMAGPVPIVFTPKIIVELKCSLEGELTVSAKILEIKREYTVGYRYTHTPDPETKSKHNIYSETDSKGGLSSVEDIFEAMTSGWSKLGASLDLGAKATLVIQPNFSLYNLNKQAGVGFALEGYAESGLKMKLTPFDPKGVYFTDEAYSNLGLDASVKAHIMVPLLGGVEGELKAEIFKVPLLAPGRITPKFDKLRTSVGNDGVSVFATMELPVFIFNMGDFGFMYCKDKPYHEQRRKEDIKHVSLANKYPEYSNIKLGWRPTAWELALLIEGFIPMDQLEEDATYYVYPYSEFYGLRLYHKSTKFTVKKPSLMKGTVLKNVVPPITGNAVFESLKDTPKAHVPLVKGQNILIK